MRETELMIDGDGGPPRIRIWDDRAIFHIEEGIAQPYCGGRCSSAGRRRLRRVEIDPRKRRVEFQMIGQAVAQREQRFHRGEMKRGITAMRRDCIAEHLMTDFTKDKILAMSLTFGIDIDRRQ